MPIMITPAQYAALDAQQLHVFAAEIANTLNSIFPGRPPGSRATARFSSAQVGRSLKHGLTRRNEMLAWVSCALVLGEDFDRTVPEVHDIVEEQNFDRAVLLTAFATRLA